MKIFYWTISVVKKLRFYITIPLLMAVVSFFSGCEKTPPAVIRLTGQTMGTYWQVSIASPLSSKEQQELQKKIEKVLLHVNQQMSTYIADSELSRFNRQLTTDFVSVSPEMYKVISKALDISVQSSGAYDITVEPLVELWGFGPKKTKKAPDEAEIKAALAKVGYQKLTLDNGKIRKSNPETSIDLSSIAKGYGVDKVGELLEKAGYPNYLVDIGGEVRGSGEKYGKHWTVAIETPEVGIYESSAESVISFTQSPLAIATSGNYRNFIDYKGVHAVHTINPKTGYSEQSDLLSASVIYDNCMTADAYATTLMALGGEDAYSFAEKQHLSALLIYAGKKPHSFIVKRTSAFIKRFGEN